MNSESEMAVDVQKLKDQVELAELRARLAEANARQVEAKNRYKAAMEERKDDR